MTTNVMTFTNLKSDSVCDCVKETHFDNSNFYIRRLKKPALIDADFVTHWERGIGTESTECVEICSYKGISINICTDENRESIFEHYRTTFNINPKKGDYCIQFKFKEMAGQIKHAPEGGDTHYNFFKSDMFSLEHIEVLQTIKYA